MSTKLLISCKTIADTTSEIQAEFESYDISEKSSNDIEDDMDDDIDDDLDDVINDEINDEINDKSKDKIEDAQTAPTEVAEANETHSLVSDKRALISCILNGSDIKTSVEIVNATRLSQVLQFEHNVTHKGIPGTCVAVLFYSPSCPFSCMAAPYFNALQRFFPPVKMVAIDAIKYRSYNTQYGVVGTPTLMLFHSGRLAVKFKETSEYGLEVFSNFITRHTGIQPIGKLAMMSMDFGGPISSIPVKETDPYLTLSWMVIAARILYSLYDSTWGRSFVDATLNAWREAEAQHHQVD